MVSTDGGGATFLALALTSVLKFRWLLRVRAARERRFRLVGRVGELHVFPFKSCAGVGVTEAVATHTGLSSGGLDDRWWMVTTMNDEVITMKELPRLSLVKVARDGNSLVVSAPEMTSLTLPAHPEVASHQQKTIHYNDADMCVLCAGAEADAWFSRFAGFKVRVYHCRPGVGTREAWAMPTPWETGAREGDRTFFAYFTAYLLTTTASLRDVNTRLATPVTSRNFRSNIVVENNEAFDEDNWDEIRIGKSAKFHYVQPCIRCVITTIDPETAEVSKKVQPLNTLKKYRQREPYSNDYYRSPVFGAYISTDCEGRICVGDPVYAIPKQPKMAAEMTSDKVEMNGILSRG